MKEIAGVMKKASLCALGRSAANPVLSSMARFSEEYAAHIIEKRCPALACKALISYRIEPELCIGCEKCNKNCPQNAIRQEDGTFAIDQSLCTRCGICFDVCPPKARAVKKISPGPSQPGDHGSLNTNLDRSRKA